MRKEIVVDLLVNIVLVRRAVRPQVAVALLIQLWFRGAASIECGGRYSRTRPALRCCGKVHPQKPIAFRNKHRARTDPIDGEHPNAFTQAKCGDRGYR